MTVGTRAFECLRTPRALLLLQLLVTTSLFFLFGGYRNEAPKIESDGKYYYQYLLSVWFDGDIDFANNYRIAPEPFMAREIDHYDFKDQLTPTGRPDNLFTIGPAILWGPFFAATYGVVSLLAGAGFASLAAPSGWELHFQYAVMLSAVVYSALALAMLFDLLREHFSEQAVAAGLLLTFWSSNWAYYCIFEPSMSHVYDVFTLALFLWIAVKAVRSEERWFSVVAGLAGGLHVLVRAQNLLTVGIVIAALAVLQARAPRGRRRAGSLVILIAGAGVALIPLLASNVAMYGRPLAMGHDKSFFGLATPELWSVLFSGRNGLFSHHPSLVLAALGLLWTAYQWRERSELVARYLVPLGLAFVTQLWINASVADWWGGHAFGQRRFISALPWFAIGFCAIYQEIIERFPGARKLVHGLVILVIAMNLYLVMIHVFMWSYDEPHDVLDWLFFRGPEQMRLYLGRGG